MLLNQDTALSTAVVLLVPYDPHHVPEYHAWMQRPELQELTASEPLTLEEEYAMQASWRADADKLTFIVCLPFAEPNSTSSVKADLDDTADQMIGDINLFLSNNIDNADATTTSPDDEGIAAEIEIMIAKPGATGQGRGRAALLAFLRYVHAHESEICSGYYTSRRGLTAAPSPRERFDFVRVKISKGNAKSIGLFESLGFAPAAAANGGAAENVFGEVELRLQRPLEEALRAWEQRWPGAVEGVRELPYERSIVLDVETGEDEGSVGGSAVGGEEDTEMAG